MNPHAICENHFVLFMIRFSHFIRSHKQVQQAETVIYTITETS